MFKRKDNSSSTLISAVSLGVTIATIFATLVAYASATNFKAGYLSYFGIDIRNIDYRPSLADFMNDPILVIMSIVVALGLYVLTALLVNGIFLVCQIIARKKGWKKLLDFTNEMIFSRGMIVWTLIILLLVLSFKLALFDSHDRGVKFARQQKNFTVIATEGDQKQVLIYQRDGVGIFKIYNSESKTFDKSYEIINVADKKFEAINLITD